MRIILLFLTATVIAFAATPSVGQIQARKGQVTLPGEHPCEVAKGCYAKVELAEYQDAAVLMHEFQVPRCPMGVTVLDTASGCRLETMQTVAIINRAETTMLACLRLHRAGTGKPIEVPCTAVRAKSTVAMPCDACTAHPSGRIVRVEVKNIRWATR